jgi:hypothetical protein
MGFFSQITATVRYLLNEKLLTGLRILSGNSKRHHENRPEAASSTVPLDEETLDTSPMRENAKARLSSNRLGHYGKR